MSEGEKKRAYRVSVRVRIRNDNDVIYGSGVSELLQHCEEKKSLNAAAKGMHMPYRKALYIVKRAEESFGHPILERTIGGVGGGGSQLTTFGRDLVARFRQMESEVAAYAEERMWTHFPELTRKRRCKMEMTVDIRGDSRVLKVPGSEVLIRETQDALDLLATANHVYDTTNILLHKAAVAEAFFDLRSGLAGDVLQKFTNYGVRVAIVGDFSGYESKALRDFIRESNRGSRIFFLPTEAEALDALHGDT